MEYFISLCVRDEDSVQHTLCVCTSREVKNKRKHTCVCQREMEIFSFVLFCVHGSKDGSRGAPPSRCHLPRPYAEVQLEGAKDRKTIRYFYLTSDQG